MSSIFKKITTFASTLGLRRLFGILMSIIGLILLIIGANGLTNSVELREFMLNLIITIYGAIELVNGLAGYFIEFRTTYYTISRISQATLVITIFIVWISYWVTRVVPIEWMSALGENILLLSLISLIDLFTIPILRELYRRKR
ncbi:MAG: hypothetical protein ACTSSJ_01670 [Candidatus Odinarchaeia archaeon]